MGQSQKVCRFESLKDEKDRKQLSFLESEAYDYFFFVTNKTELLPEEGVEFYEKRGNCENYIKEARYDMEVGHLLLQSFWANEAIFQIMMLTSACYSRYQVVRWFAKNDAKWRKLPCYPRLPSTGVIMLDWWNWVYDSQIRLR